MPRWTPYTLRTPTFTASGTTRSILATVLMSDQIVSDQVITRWNTSSLHLPSQSTPPHSPTSALYKEFLCPPPPQPRWEHYTRTTTQCEEPTTRRLAAVCRYHSFAALGRPSAGAVRDRRLWSLATVAALTRYVAFGRLPLEAREAVATTPAATAPKHSWPPRAIE